MEDIRCRYYYTIFIDDKKVFEGFLLHEEGWQCLSLDRDKKITCSFLSGKVSKKTDTSFQEFYKNHFKKDNKTSVGIMNEA